VISKAARRVLGRRSRLVGAAAENAIAILGGSLRASDAVVVISRLLPRLRREVTKGASM
jgi:hypothetical protein